MLMKFYVLSLLYPNKVTFIGNAELEGSSTSITHEIRRFDNTEILVVGAVTAVRPKKVLFFLFIKSP